MAKIPLSFYLRDDVVQIAKDLLGKYLFTNLNGEGITGGIITETEAYAGVTDKASHAYGNRRTARTEVMYVKGGVAYVYLCYGMHSLFNIVTNKKDVPHAVLIRGIKPMEGLHVMRKRANKKETDKLAGKGPGVVSKLLGIHYSQSGEPLSKNKIWLEDRGLIIPKKKIIVDKRVGIDYAGEDALLPYRFLIDEKTIQKRQ